MTRPAQSASPFRHAGALAAAALHLALAGLAAHAQEPPPVAPPPPPQESAASVQGPCEIRNWKEVLDLWQAPAPAAGGQFLRAAAAVQINTTEEGDAEFPIFSPTGDKLVFTISTDRSGRRANLLRVLSPERLQKASPRLLEVSSRAQAEVPVFGGAVSSGIRSHDSQVYFSWLTSSDFIYYSRVHEKIFKGQFSPTASQVEAVQVASEAAITLHGWRSEILCQNLRGIASATSAGASAPIIKLGSTLVDGKPLELATMPAVCPSNPSVFAFIGRLRESSSTDLCVRFGEDNIVRADTPDGWEKMPVWSPDGQHIALYSTRTNPRASEYGVWALRVDHNARRLGPMFNVSGDDQISPHDLRDARRSGGPAWSPDSRQILYFAKSRRGAAEQEDCYILKSFDIRYGEDEGALAVSTPPGLLLNSPGDIDCCPAGSLIAFTNAVTKESQRDYRVVLLKTSLPGAPAR